jgi:hypothetical protein
MNKDELRIFVDSLDWKFAKAYADISPHDYIVKSKLDPGCQVILEEVVNFIREAGFEARYKGHPGKYYILNGHYYGTMGEPIGQTTIINRAKLIDYSLVESN